MLTAAKSATPMPTIKSASLMRPAALRDGSAILRAGTRFCLRRKGDSGSGSRSSGRTDSGASRVVTKSSSYPVTLRTRARDEKSGSPSDVGPFVRAIEPKSKRIAALGHYNGAKKRGGVESLMRAEISEEKGEEIVGSEKWKVKLAAGRGRRVLGVAGLGTMDDRGSGLPTRVGLANDLVCTFGVAGRGLPLNF